MIRIVLDESNEGMQVALAPDSDLDPKNKQMNRELIERHEQILAKLDRDEDLNEEDLALVRDATEIHMNDALNLNGHHREALALEDWLYKVTEIDRSKAMQMLEQWLNRNSQTPGWVYRALHILCEEAMSSSADTPAFDDEGRCLKCGRKLPVKRIKESDSLTLKSRS